MSHCVILLLTKTHELHPMRFMVKLGPNGRAAAGWQLPTQQLRTHHVLYGKVDWCEQLFFSWRLHQMA
jgi:hypothetical protein